MSEELNQGGDEIVNNQTEDINTDTHQLNYFETHDQNEQNGEEGGDNVEDGGEAQNGDRVKEEYYRKEVTETMYRVGEDGNLNVDQEGGGDLANNTDQVNQDLGKEGIENGGEEQQNVEVKIETQKEEKNENLQNNEEVQPKSDENVKIESEEKVTETKEEKKDESQPDSQVLKTTEVKEVTTIETVTKSTSEPKNDEKDKDKKETKSPAQTDETSKRRHVYSSRPQDDNSGNKKEYHFTSVTKTSTSNTNQKPSTSSRPVIDVSKYMNTQNNKKTTTTVTTKTTTVTTRTGNTSQTTQQTLQSKRNAPQASQPMKYQPRKYDSSKVTTTTTTTTNIPQQTKKTTIQNTNVVQSKYQPRKYEPSKPSVVTTTYTTTSNNTGGNTNAVKNTSYTRQVYTSNVSSNQNEPKLKYYVRCPNCNYLLNDEAAYNKAFGGRTGSYTTNTKGSNYSYEHKTYTTKTEQKSNYGNNNPSNTSGRRNVGYTQKTTTTETKKDYKNVPAGSNVTYYESSYVSSRKTKQSSNAVKK